MRWLRSLWWRSRPRCGNPGVFLPYDADACVRPRGHERWDEKYGPTWHADGCGYIWDATEWRWMGPVR